MENQDKNTLTLSVKQAAALLSLSRHSIYAAIARGELPSLKLGKRILIPKAALEKILSNPSQQ